MTNQEAIKWFKENPFYHKDHKPFNMAIEALEQEPKIRQALEQEKGAYNALVKNIQCADAISRQAVLNTLDKMDKALDTDRTVESYKELLTECYKVLPSVKQEPCDDAISRQLAIDTMAKLEQEDIDTYGCFIPEGFDGERAIEALKQLPSVNPQEKTGHWIVHPKGVYAHLVCDKCLSNAPYDCKTNYCPNCGAKMESEDKK